ncbi:anti-sigma factor [Novosphingobium sp.]|uniref:anti-sigma factor n=1 Tax=Novosphingobium sp. TaxID=1874826 RepID=UPI0033404618
MTTADDPDLLAAELAFGLIDGADAAAAQTLLDRDTAFQALYDRWLGYALALFGDCSEQPPAWIWPAIERRLPANDTRMQLHAQVTRWRFAAMAVSVAAVIAGIGGLAINRVPAPAASQIAQVAPAPSAPMVAMLRGATGVVSVAYDPAQARLTLASNALALAHGKSAELWVIPADGKPRALGLIPVDHPGWAAAPATSAALLTEGATLAVSVEPAGGSPTGLPTGPVILTGKLALAG